MKKLIAKVMVIATMAICMLSVSSSSKAQTGTLPPSYNGTKFNVHVYSQGIYNNNYTLICTPKGADLIYGPNAKWCTMFEEEFIPSFGAPYERYVYVDGVQYMYRDYSPLTPQGLMAVDNQFTFKFSSYSTSTSKVIYTSARTYDVNLFIGANGELEIK